MGDLTKNFSKSEFACLHCKRTFIDQKLVEALQKIRDVVGRSVYILSAYRCATHNAKIGGAKNSMHLAGRAADIQVDQLDTKQLLDLVLTMPEFTGIGFYVEEHFIHVDTRPGPRVTWSRILRDGKYSSLDEGIKQWDSLKTKTKTRL